MKNDDNVEVWTDPEQEAKVVAMLMGELSAFEMAELEEELSQSPELRLFRDRMIDVQGLISEVNEQEKEEDDWKLSSERRSDLLENIAQPVRIEKVEVKYSRERKDTTSIQWKSVLSIAACLIVSLVLTAVVFPFKLFTKPTIYKNREETVSYSAGELPRSREEIEGRRDEVIAEYKAKIEAQEDKVADNRARLYKLSKSLGVPYHGINSQVVSTYDQDRKANSGGAIYDSAKRERDQLEVLVKDLQNLDDKRLATRILASNRPEAIILKEDDSKIKELSLAKGNLLASGLNNNHPRIVKLDEAISTSERQLQESTRLTREKLSGDLATMNKRIEGLKKDESSKSSYQMSSAEDHTQFGKVKDEYEREFNKLQKLKSAEFRESISSGLAMDLPSRSNLGASGGELAANQKLRKSESVKGRRELSELDDLVWASEEITKPEMSNTAPKRPSAPGSSMAKVIAANTPSPTNIPVPSIAVNEPSLDFGDGDDFGAGWGAGSGSGGGLVTNGLRSGDFAITSESVDAFLNNPKGRALGLDDSLLPKKTEATDSLIQQQIIRRSAGVADADKSVINGRAAYLKKDYKGAVEEYKKAMDLLPRGPIAADRRKSYEKHLADGETALATQYRRSGRYDEARELLNSAVARNPKNQSAQKQLEYLDDPIRTSPTLTTEQVQDVEKVRKLLYRGESYFNQAQFDDATTEYKEILRVDPYNKAARRGMEKVNAAKSDYYRAAYDQTRAEMLMEVDGAWETAVPATPEKQKSLSKSQLTRDRLQRIELENLEFTEDTTVRQAINFLRLRARELDTDEVDADKRGLNFKFRDRAVSDSGLDSFHESEEAGGFGDSSKIENIKVGELNLRNIPIEEALKQIAQKTGLRYKVEDEGIVLMRATDVDDSDFYTRTFKVPENFDQLLKDGDGDDYAGGDPFDDGGNSSENPTINELIARSGIPIPEGATAAYSKEKGTITFRNTANNLDIFEDLVTEVKKKAPRPGQIFLKAYTALEKYEKLIQSGEKRQALVQLKSALQTYQELSQKHPGWKVPLVQLRLKETKRRIDELNKPEQMKPSKPQVLPLETLATDKADSTFSLNVSDVSFELAKVAMLEKNSTPEPVKIRVEEFVNAFDYGDPSAAGKKVACVIEQCAHPVYQQRNLMRIGMKTGAIGRSQPLRLTILLDNSGSMEREDREATVIKAIEALASKLGPDDEVTLLSFARDARLVAQKLKGDQAGKLVQLVKSIPSEGGTNLSKAITRAHSLAKKGVSKDAMSRVVLITDGAANLGNADPEELSKSIVTMRQDGIAFDACGVGADGLDDEMLETLTRKGDGRYYFINNAKDADAGFAEKLAGALRPAAKNVKVQVIFNPERVGNYRLLGFEKHLLKKEDFRNDRVDAAEMAAEEAGNALYQVEALPGGRGDIGRVFVRFMDMETGKMVERNWTIPYDSQASNIMDAKPSMQLASVAGLLGEKLKFGESANIDISRLQDTISKLRVHYHNDQKVKDLIRMTEKTTR